MQVLRSDFFVYKDFHFRLLVEGTMFKKFEIQPVLVLRRGNIVLRYFLSLILGFSLLHSKKPNLVKIP